MGFASPVDICLRALQHVGANTAGFTALTEQSKRATELSIAYDKCRKAELQRNVWRFAVRKASLRAIDTTTVFIVPAAWDATIPYASGQIVAYGGAYYISQTPNNLNNTPGQGTDAGLWDAYFGPLGAFPYDSTQSYFASELVYETKGVNALLIYYSLATGNVLDPSTTQAWSAASSYNRNNVVLSGGFYWLSLIDRNLNQTPGAYKVWQASLSYSKENLAYSTVDGYVYSSLVDSNKGNEPSATANTDWNNTGIKAPWASSFYQPTGDLGWIRQTASENPTDIIYPLGSGPASQDATRNAFRLPNGYLRTAPQDPSAGNVSTLGFPSNLLMTDWQYDGNFIVSRSSDPIVLRFVADVTNVGQMDTMFCEGLAARIGLEICEPLTQSTSKLEAIASMYKRFMGEARLVNGIEEQTTQPPLDDWIACRA